MSALVDGIELVPSIKFIHNGVNMSTFFIGIGILYSIVVATIPDDLEGAIPTFIRVSAAVVLISIFVSLLGAK